MAAVTGAKKRQIIEMTVKAINKAMPNEGLGRYRDIGKDIDVKTISTGSMAVDAAIGGGFAKGRIINIIGHTSSGKTTLALTSIANLQKEDPDANILFCDAEQTFDPRYAESLGVNVDDLFIVQPSSGEAGFQAVEMFMQSGVADMVVVDSVAAMLPKSIIERDYEKESQPGQFAKLISTAVGRINRLTKNNRCTVILINQWKPVVKMSQFAAVGGSMGNWYQPGGAQLQFFSSQMIEVRKSGEIKSGAEVKSSITTMTCKKNKIAPPYQTADFVITYGQGLDKMQEIISLGFSFDLIEISGSFYKIPAIMEKTIQGKIKFAKYLEENKEAYDYLVNEIKNKISGKRDIVYKKMDDSEEVPEEKDHEDSFYEENQDLEKAGLTEDDVEKGISVEAPSTEIKESAVVKPEEVKTEENKPVELNKQEEAEVESTENNSEEAKPEENKSEENKVETQEGQDDSKDAKGKDTRKRRR